jgi:hypothetical protein
MAALMVAAVVIASLVDNNNRQKGFFVQLMYIHGEDILLRSLPIFASSTVFFQKCSL